MVLTLLIFPGQAPGVADGTGGGAFLAFSVTLGLFHGWEMRALVVVEIDAAGR